MAIIIRINLFNHDDISKILYTVYIYLTFEKHQNSTEFFNMNQDIDSVVETPLHMPFGYNLISSVGLTRGGD